MEDYKTGKNIMRMEICKIIFNFSMEQGTFENDELEGNGTKYY